MPVEVNCKQCGKTQLVIPARAKTYKFCSYACKGEWVKLNNVGENHPRWLGGERSKICGYCKTEFHIRQGQPITQFKTQKFCCKSCADKGGIRYSGSENGNYNGNPRRKHRSSQHAKWSKNVISRDLATCQHCGVKDVELHAHHIKGYKEFPELRWELSNGITLCYSCHWLVHSASNANGVNSGELASRNGGDNPEPSQDRKVLEGVTTRGRAYRRIEGKCNECGKFISKRISNVHPSGRMFCSRQCSGKFIYKLRGPIRLRQ